MHQSIRSNVRYNKSLINCMGRLEKVRACGKVSFIHGLLLQRYLSGCPYDFVCVLRLEKSPKFRPNLSHGQAPFASMGKIFVEETLIENNIFLLCGRHEPGSLSSVA
jgi:hypothetical protein